MLAQASQASTATPTEEPRPTATEPQLLMHEIVDGKVCGLEWRGPELWLTVDGEGRPVDPQHVFKSLRPRTGGDTIETATTPRTFTITDKDTAEKLTFTCMPGCIVAHEVIDCSRPVASDDVCCMGDDNGRVSLPFEGVSAPKEAYVLRAFVRAAPFSKVMAERLPHVVFEVVEDEYVVGLDPDSLAVVIGVFEERLEALRCTYADLVQTRAEVLARTVQAARAGSEATA
ncbi:hypothetical protein PV381_21895 [Streptomyces scabiei]|nr:MULTISPECIES: hypothetical protein [Streptomyces]MBP5915893.1 hypothetical protein [Streptomyces sp. LBUM 1486]MDX2629176.1 hypothetical protein [Streptomyces scabiei]MDX3030254.1 hypothetical protein [Streptomyces scabiei]MDX3168257.1 hypothetical protein [Streptomyces scabiei]MDX3207799.1 hypothetical protein [Streptomyces scabiei]